MRRPTAYCEMCESTVYADDVHSCYDAKRVRTVAEAERAVVEAAERFEVAERGFEDDVLRYAEAYNDLIDAVRRLREARGDA